MTLTDQIVNLKPNMILRGPLFSEPVQVIVAIPMGDSVKLIGKGLRTGQVHEPILSPQQLATLEITPEQEPFDGDAARFRLGVEALRIAQEGRGKQFSDDPKGPVGGNCYACHQLSPQEVSFGTIGPSLYGFAKLRGFNDETRKYAYGKIWNADAYSACSNMPRFGHSQILSEQQVKDLVALLTDPDSPVNK